MFPPPCEGAEQGWAGVVRPSVWCTAGEKGLEMKLLRLIRPLGSGGPGWGGPGSFRCALSSLRPLKCKSSNNPV